MYLRNKEIILAYYCSPFGKCRVDPYGVDILCIVNTISSTYDMVLTHLHYDISSYSVLAEVIVLTVQNDRNRVIRIKLFQEFGTNDCCVERILPTIWSNSP